MSATITAPATVGFMPRKASSTDEQATVKLDRSLLRDIKTLASFHGQDAGPWLTRFLRPLIAEEISRMADALHKRAATERQGRQK
jgi:hypothetical protein